MPEHDHSVIARSKRRLRTRSIGFNREIKVGCLDRANINIVVAHVRHHLHGTKAQSSKRQAGSNAVERLSAKPHEIALPDGRSGLKRGRS